MASEWKGRVTTFRLLCPNIANWAPPPPSQFKPLFQPTSTPVAMTFPPALSTFPSHGWTVDFGQFYVIRKEPLGTTKKKKTFFFYSSFYSFFSFSPIFPFFQQKINPFSSATCIFSVVCYLRYSPFPIRLNLNLPQFYSTPSFLQNVESLTAFFFHSLCLLKDKKAHLPQ